MSDVIVGTGSAVSFANGCETAATRKVCFDSFNISAGYVADERGYQSICKALKDKFPDGVDV